MILDLRASAGLNIRIAVERDGKHQTGTLQGLLNRSSKAQVLVGLLEQLATGIWDDKTHRTGISHHPPFFLNLFSITFSSRTIPSDAPCSAHLVQGGVGDGRRLRGG